MSVVVRLEINLETLITSCPIDFTIDVVGGKWKPLILYYLLEGTKRFGQLQRLLPHVTRRMLTQHLRELERDGIVYRQVYSQIPPMVEYSLTTLGCSLEPVLLAMLDWGQTHKSEVQEHRDKYQSAS